MSANVISHHAPHGKRADAGLLTMPRIGVVIVAVAGVIVASLLASAPDRAAKARDHTPPQVAQSPALPPAPEVAAVNATADLTGAPLPRRLPRAVPRTGVPLDATAVLEPAGYEILSAAELDGISQARE